MNRYFYSVESDNGVMFLHLFGNVYKNDSGDEKDYSCAEWTHFYVKVEEAKKMLAAGKFFDYADEWVCYLDNISEESAQNICYRYFGDYSGIELSIADISENTPVNNYCYLYSHFTFSRFICHREPVLPSFHRTNNRAGQPLFSLHPRQYLHF